jgi:hypothetical protein
MGYLNLLLILLVAALSSFESVSVAKEQTPTPVTPDQLRGEIMGSAERTQETLRKEIKQAQKETEERISATLMDPLNETIRSLKKKVDDAPPWWVPIVGSAVLAALLAYGFSWLASRQKQKKADDENKFIRVEFPALKRSLQASIKDHTNEIDTAIRYLQYVMDSPIVKPHDGFSIEDLGSFNDRACMDQVKSLNVSTVQSNFPAEGKRHTRDLATLLQPHQNQTRKLNQRLAAFSLLLRHLSMYEERDERVFARFGVDSIPKLRESEAYQNELKAELQTITTAAKELNYSTKKIESELEKLERVLTESGHCP